MLSLRELQARFARAVFERDAGDFPAIRGNGLDPARRLAVYRHNVCAGLTEALRDGFPVTNRLVGEAFFGVMAREFIRRHPPRSGCLLDYGAEFAGFVERFEPAAGLGYLPDVMRLEWAFHSAFHAADAPSLDPAALEAVPPERQASLRLRLHPSVRLLASRWPVLRIYEVNQPGFAGDGTVDLGREPGCRVLAIRRALEVEFHPLTAGEFTFLAALARNQELGPAFAEARADDPGFDPTAALLSGFGRGVFSQPLGF